MKKLQILLSLCLLSVLPVCAKERSTGSGPAASSASVTHVGVELNPEKTLNSYRPPIADIIANPSLYNGREIILSGYFGKGVGRCRKYTAIISPGVPEQKLFLTYNWLYFSRDDALYQDVSNAIGLEPTDTVVLHNKFKTGARVTVRGIFKQNESFPTNGSIGRLDLLNIDVARGNENKPI